MQIRHNLNKIIKKTFPVSFVIFVIIIIFIFFIFRTTVSGCIRDTLCWFILWRWH